MLTEDLTIAGPIRVRLKISVSTTGTDSDFVVKMIDVYPGDYPSPEPPEGQPLLPNAIKMGGYQQLSSWRTFPGQVSEQSRKTGAVGTRATDGYRFRCYPLCITLSARATG